MEDESETVMLNQAFVTHPKTGRPVPVPNGPDGQPQFPPIPPGMGPKPEIKNYDLRKGIYSVSISIGKSYQTRLQQGADEIGEILTARPELMPLIGPIYFKFRDFPGASEIGDLLAKVRDKQMPGLMGDEQGPTPEQAQAQMQATGQQMKAMQSQLEQAMKAIETDQAKQQATIMKAEMDNASRERIAAMNQETKLAVEGMSQKMDVVMAALQHANERKRAEFDAAHDVAKGAAQAEQAATVKAMDLTFRAPNTQPLGQEDEY
jgi:hypothetical protein